MGYRFVRRMRPLRWSANLAGLAAGLSLTGCLAVYWVESAAYANMAPDRLDKLVGVKGDCCNPGLKTNCSDKSPFACTTAGVVCESTNAYDNCANPSCNDSSSSSDACSSQYFAGYSVTVTICNGIPGAEVYCSTGTGTHCMYTTSSATVNFSGCGQNSICSPSQGPACQ